MNSKVVRLLERSKAFGFLGPGDVEAHILHADRFIEAVGSVSGLGIDMGTGGGVPGICLAVARSDIHWTFLDANIRRCTFLRQAIEELRMKNAVVVEGRAEVIARLSPHRQAFDVATARSFGPPAVVAENATGFLKVGGILVVSEPPGSPDRWSSPGLMQLGMKPVATSSSGIQVVEQVSPCADKWPRRTGVPSKRPLF